MIQKQKANITEKVANTVLLMQLKRCGGFLVKIYFIFHPWPCTN